MLLGSSFNLRFTTPARMIFGTLFSSSPVHLHAMILCPNLPEASKPQSMRLQKIRPSPLTPMGRPHIPAPVSATTPFHAPAQLDCMLWMMRLNFIKFLGLRRVGVDIFFYVMNSNVAKKRDSLSLFKMHTMHYYLGPPPHLP